MSEILKSKKNILAHIFIFVVSNLFIFKWFDNKSECRE
jgi:hypothetical protein